jgi:hypothetical protein
MAYSCSASQVLEQLASRFTLPEKSTVPGPTVCQVHRSIGIAYWTVSVASMAKLTQSEPLRATSVTSLRSPPEPVAVHATRVNAHLGYVTCSPLPPTPASRSPT